MSGRLQSDLPPTGQRAPVLLQRIAGAHTLGQVLLQAVIAASTEITQPVRTVLDLRPDGLEDVAALRIGLGVLQGCDSPLSIAKVDRSGLQGVRRILRVQRAVLEARGQHLRTRLECLGRRAMPVLTNICDYLLQQIPHTAIRRITGQLVMHVHPVVGDLIGLVRLCVAHHGLQCLKRLA
ncbi:hypothetical protein ACIGT4_27240 [Streptomyces sioyaensis]|uniref:hypothetical protein n=1 Tax=Streptomyces sioyaensis TaxID=67364 RepID=UPI0037CD8851